MAGTMVGEGGKPGLRAARHAGRCSYALSIPEKSFSRDQSIVVEPREKSFRSEEPGDNECREEVMGSRCFHGAKTAPSGIGTWSYSTSFESASRCEAT